MKLWLLRPVDPRPQSDPWDPWYDKAFGFVVRAETKKIARLYASQEAGDETRGVLGNPWLSPSMSTCVELTPKGEPGVVLRDFQSA